MTRLSMKRSAITCLTGLAALGLYPGALLAQQPVPDAPAWQLFDRMEGVEGRNCSARSSGPEANTRLLLNEAGVPVLIAARPDWRNESRETEIRLSIDGAEPVRAQGFILVNLVLVKIDDASLLRRLRGARTIDWRFPFGSFRANVEGLGKALDAVRLCRDTPNVAS